MSKLKSTLRRIYLILDWRKKYILRKFKKVDQLRLNLGCGSDLQSGYINIDRNPKYRPDMIADVVTAVESFGESCVDEILAIHVSNYLPQSQLMVFLKQSFRILVPGGILIIEGPDFEKFIERLDLKNFEPEFLYPLFATNFEGPTHDKPYVNAISFGWLREIAISTGFKNVKVENPQTHGKLSARDSRLVAFK